MVDVDVDVDVDVVSMMAGGGAACAPIYAVNATSSWQAFLFGLGSFYHGEIQQQPEERCVINDVSSEEGLSGVFGLCRLRSQPSSR